MNKIKKIVNCLKNIIRLYKQNDYKKKYLLYAFLFFSFLFITNPLHSTFRSVSNQIESQYGQRLIQTTTDEEMWESYINLGLYRTIIEENEDIDSMQEKILKSIVCIKMRKNTKKELYNGKGSGFIIDIDKNNLYIITNKHVAKGLNGIKGGYCLFFYPYELYQSIKNNDLSQENALFGDSSCRATLVALDTKNDIALLKVDISNINYKDREIFKAIPKIKDININKDEKIYIHRVFDKERTSKIVQGLVINNNPCYKSFYNSKIIETTPISIHGDSGNYVFNNKGEFIGIVCGNYTVNGKIAYSDIIPYQEVCYFFEETMGYSLIKKDTNVEETVEELETISQ